MRCSVVEIYHRSEAMYYLHLQGQKSIPSKQRIERRLYWEMVLIEIFIILCGFYGRSSGT
jgi:hypothetical protein